MQVGTPHIDRDAQFQFINEHAKMFMEEGNPVISVDTKKKELVGNFANTGGEYCQKGSPKQVLDHDFPLKELGKVNPYGVYDIINNVGYVNLGISADTAEFAVESIERWWNSLGKAAYPKATALYINCDGGGSNGSRVKAWKVGLQKLATKIGIDIQVSHFPPGASKWNKIEHRMFSFISKNRRGVPLETIEVIISLIASTKTEKGLTVSCVLDNKQYEKGIKITEAELAAISLIREEFHGNWNYTITCQNKQVIS